MGLQFITQQMIAQIIFIAAVTMIMLIYVGYPLLMFVLSRIFSQPIRKIAITPKVSVIIAAHNEEQSIAEKIENTLELDYPRDRIEVIVASDCSSDRTDQIVRSFDDRGVILHRENEHHGKTYAQNRAVGMSSGEILIFSDATTIYERDVLKKIVRNFADPSVGCVAGQLIYVNDRSSTVGAGCRSYWGYEKTLKNFESRLGSLIGVSGCLYAVRRSCHARLASDMIDDFAIASLIHLQGLRTVYEPEAISKEETNHRSKDEFRMRVRVIEQTMRVLYRYRKLLNPLKHGMFAVQLLCHKVLRYTVPVWLLIAFIANLFIIDARDLYQYIYLGQLLFVIAASFGWIGERFKVSLGPLSMPYYFTLVNLATLVAFTKFMRGETHVVWEPVREVPKSREVVVNR